MKSNHRFRLYQLLAAVLLLLCGTARSQGKPQTKPSGRNPLAHLPKLGPKLGPNFLNRLSSGGATMFHVANVLSDPSIMRGAESPQARLTLEKSKAILNLRSRPTLPAFTEQELEAGRHAPDPVPVNDAGLDFQLTRFTGFSQGETSSAWCGDTVVVGFNDSGAFVRSVVEQVGGASFTGVAASQNRGRTFVGLPFLNPGSDPATFLGGDPVLVCSDSRHFFYSSLYSHVTFDAQGNVLEALSGISVSHSSSAGLAWNDPIPAVTKDANSHFLDKEWMAIDPHDPRKLYVTYTDFGASGSDSTCDDHTTPGIPLGPDVRIEMVSSKDGGNSWSSPVLIEHHCAIELEQNLSGTQVAVGPKGQVYVAYASIDQKTAEIRIRKSDDGGATFARTVIVTTAAAASSVGLFNLEGDFRTNEFPSLAVDPKHGTLYMVWTDASRNQAPDSYANLFLGDPLYAFGDIVLAVSHDDGKTWSLPAVVSPTPSDFKGAGRDQFMAGVSVDARGGLAVCYSDRRNDPNNLAIDHFCSLSSDQGRTFHDVRETPFSWSPAHLTDVFLNPTYMGDYDTVSVDSTGVHAGFFSTFQVQTNTNPDVFGMSLKP